MKLFLWSVGNKPNKCFVFTSIYSQKAMIYANPSKSCLAYRLILHNQSLQNYHSHLSNTLWNLRFTLFTYKVLLLFNFKHFAPFPLQRCVDEASTKLPNINSTQTDMVICKVVTCHVLTNESVTFQSDGKPSFFSVTSSFNVIYKTIKTWLWLLFSWFYMVFLRVKSYQEEQSINKTKIPIFCSNVIWYFWNTTTISCFQKRF